MNSFKTELIRYNIDRIILKFLTDGHTEQYKDLNDYLETKTKEHSNSDLTLQDLIPIISKLSPEHSAIVAELNGIYSIIENINNKLPVIGKDIDESDIELVMSQTGATHSAAFHALVKNDGDIVDSIMDLTSIESPPIKLNQLF